MGRFNKYLGATEIEVGGEKLVLKATVEDQQKLINLKDKKDQLVETVSILLGIMTKSYPDEPKEEMEAFVMKHSMDFMKKLVVAWKWAKSEEEIDQTIQKAVEKTAAPLLKKG